MTKLYLDDIAAGQIFQSDTYEVSVKSIKDFAALWDPQVFHLDEVGAADSFFQGLAASGWQTACITMRLLVTSGFTPANGVIGAGIEELKWFRPVRPGDVLRAEMEVLEVRPMRSKPGYGICRMRVTTVDATGEPVQVFTSPLVVQSKG